MKIRIVRDVDHRPKPADIQAFRAGTTVNVPRNTAEALIASGAAHQLSNTRKEARDGDLE